MKSDRFFNSGNDEDVVFERDEDGNPVLGIRVSSLEICSALPDDLKQTLEYIADEQGSKDLAECVQYLSDTDRERYNITIQELIKKKVAAYAKSFSTEVFDTISNAVAESILENDDVLHIPFENKLVKIPEHFARTMCVMKDAVKNGTDNKLRVFISTVLTRLSSIIPNKVFASSSYFLSRCDVLVNDEKETARGTVLTLYIKEWGIFISTTDVIANDYNIDSGADAKPLVASVDFDTLNGIIKTIICVKYHE